LTTLAPLFAAVKAPEFTADNVNALIAH
jgi:hypothetical protein